MDNVVFQITQILHRVADESSPVRQVNLIVDSISEALKVDVCSLYLLNENQDAVLYASHGLVAKRHISLSKGQGLIGKVIQTRHTINVADAAAEPGFLFIPGTGEQEYKSFCGVPLVRHGHVIGGLVVQSRQAEKLAPENEALLVTLAAHLALITPSAPQLSPSSLMNKRITGIKGSGGIAIGRVHLVSTSSLSTVIAGENSDPEQETERWRSLKLQVNADLEREKTALSSQTSGNDISGVFDAYQLLLTDPAFGQKVETEINAGANIPTALKRAVHRFADVFKAMDDPYLASRADDMYHLGNKILSIYNSEQQVLATETQHDLILVGHDISISDIASIPKESLAGILCAEGSHLSHTAVLANALGIPAILGVGSLSGFSQGQALIIDADKSQAVLNPSSFILSEYRRTQSHQRLQQEKLKSLCNLPAITKDGREIKLFANSGLLSDISPSIESGAEGIGLYRTEIPFMTCQAFPSEEEQVAIYVEVFKGFAGKPVYMRVLDIGGDKQLPYFQIKNEVNPALGWRGIRFGLDNVQLLMTQVRAMILAAGESNSLHILIPMVSSKEQIVMFRQLVTDAVEQLREEGKTVNRPQVGCMIEVPASISQIPLWAKQLDFVSIGSNDLSQYLLSVDRNNPKVAGIYDPVHPAVIHEVNRAVQLAAQHHIPVSLCGEMATDRIAAVLLVGMGIKKLSMGAAYLPRIKSLIRKMRYQDARDILTQALTLSTTTEIREYVEQYLAPLEEDS